MSDEWALTPIEEAAMDAATAALIEQLTVDSRFATLSLVKITGALAARTAGCYSAMQGEFSEQDAADLCELKVRHFEAGVAAVAENMKTIGSA